MMTDTGGSRRIEASEPADTPTGGFLFAYAALVPLAVGALSLWLAPRGLSFLILNAVLIFGAALLTFFAGVRRGVSFRQPGGPTTAQIATMLWLFLAGIAALFAVAWGFPFPASVVELAGFASLGVLDPRAARRGEAPLFFARLRPLQMGLATVLLAVVAAYAWQHASL